MTESAQEGCRATVGFLTRYDEELMEPLVQCQVSQVSMRVARGSAYPKEACFSLLL